MKVNQNKNRRINRSLVGSIQSIPGIILALVLSGFPPLAQSQSAPPSAQETVTHLVPSGMIVTTDSSLRGAEGELHVAVGSSTGLLSPESWYAPASDIVVCTTVEKKCRYLFRFSQSRIGPATSAYNVGILNVTAFNRSGSTQDVFIELYWQITSDDERLPMGISLESTHGLYPDSARESLSWNPKSNWYFTQDCLVVENRVLYIVSQYDGWEKVTWVRKPRFPYRDITVTSPLGFTQLTCSLEHNKQITLQVLVPYRPVLLENLDSLVPFIRSGESKPTDPPTLQNKK